MDEILDELNVQLMVPHILANLQQQAEHFSSSFLGTFF
jgi:hypothetical protein